MSMEALYPDGRRELLSSVNRYDHNWQIAYIYEDEVQPILPKGTVLSYYIPILTIRKIIQSTLIPISGCYLGHVEVDEMSHAWIGMTYLDDENFCSVNCRTTVPFKSKKGNSPLSMS